MASHWRGNLPVICDLCFNPSQPYQKDNQESCSMTPDEMIDCEGLLCPLPVLKARKRLLQMQEGAVLGVRATDPMTAIDMPHFCAEAGHSLLNTQQNGAVKIYTIRRGPDKI